MANEIDINIGTFDLDSSNGISVEDIQFRINKNVQEFDITKAHGSIIPIAKRKSAGFNVRGKVNASDYDALRTALDNLKNALESSSEFKFTTDDDRYMNVQCRSFSQSWLAIRTVAEFSFELVASYPFWLAASITTDSRTPTSGVGYTVNNPGNAYARAKITITAGGSAISDDIKFQNSTVGQLFQYRGDLASTEALVINNRLDGVDLEVLNDGDDAIMDFDGDFITLAPGDNTLIFTSGASSPTVTVAFRPTYL